MINTSFIATGDSFITRKIPDKNSKNYKEIVKLIRSANVRFTNLEVTAHNYEGFPAATSGGTWAIAPSHIINELLSYGFNLFAWANNHTLDYSHGGLLATKKNLDRLGVVHVGVGENLSEASAPKYLETPSGRVAIVACTSTFTEGAEAGDQRPDIIGRPGINPLRFETVYKVPKKYLDSLKTVTQNTSINARRELDIKEGFEIEDDSNTLTFGDYKFIQGEDFDTFTNPFENDIKRIKKSIEEAKRNADYVMFSMHFHEMNGKEKNQPAEFARKTSRIAIDSGADCVIGHGPHILRGIELYKGKPIFYSLGNFIFQSETVERLPSDFYQKYSLDHTHNVGEAFEKRTNKDTLGLGVIPGVWHAVIPYWEMEEGELIKLELYPIELGFNKPRHQRGWPILSKNKIILKEIQELSAPFGTEMIMERGRAIVKL